MIGFDFATGGTFTLTVDGVTTAPIVYTNASTFASVTTQITDALNAIGKTYHFRLFGYKRYNLYPFEKRL